ncbi:MAG: DUF2218 domain-containing protein [Bauldia litoralis]
MLTRSATITTDRASIYLQQLCKHFGHKVPVDFTPEAGRIELPFGTCTLRADGDTLSLDVTGGAGDLDRLEKVIGDHLTRFAFREKPEIKWRSTATALPAGSVET